MDLLLVALIISTVMGGLAVLLRWTDRNHDAASAADGQDDPLESFRQRNHDILFNPSHPQYKARTKEYVRLFEKHNKLKPTEWAR